MIVSEELLIALVFLGGLLILCGTGLRVWQSWLAFNERKLENRQPPSTEELANTGAARIELADLKERIRKLEAIASGVDL